MKRLLIVLGLIASLSAAACSGDASDASDDSTDRAVALLASALGDEDYARSLFTSDRQKRCMAEGIVARLGIERLEELGLDIDDRDAPDLFRPALTEAEGDRLYAVADGCLDFEQRDIEAFMAEGLSEREARCVSASYRGSGIPRLHSSEPPHTNDPSEVEAHNYLDTFLEVAKSACRAWM